MRACYQIMLPLLGLFLNRELFTGIYPIKSNIQILKILDGDTIEARVMGHKERIRLLGIDAPEKAQPTRIGNLSAGELSTKCLENILKKSDWQLEWHGRDIYGRVLGELWSSNKSIGLLMLRQGCASTYPFMAGLSLRRKNELLLALNQAKKLRLGLWKYGGFMRPYFWRKSQKTKRTPVARE